MKGCVVCEGMDFNIPWHHSDLHQIQLVDDILKA